MMVAMPTYVTKEVAKIWKRIVQEFQVEWPILCEKWKYIIFGLLFQYVHGIATRSAHFLHHAAPLLHDIGFSLLPELGKERSYMSELVFLFIVLPFVVWTFHPFVFHNKRFYTVVLWVKAFTVLVVSASKPKCGPPPSPVAEICQFFRILSFSATQLPGPNYHCREGSPMATLQAPKNIQDALVINLRTGVLFGCGDLIFSSHMTFTLTFVLTYNRYGTTRILKQLGFLLAAIQSLLIIASRKHYSVDVVVAWYVVPLVFFFVDKKLHTDSVREHSGDREAATPLLPITSEHKNARSKEEHPRVPAGASKDHERRKHLQMNGKHSAEDAGSGNEFEPPGTVSA